MIPSAEASTNPSRNSCTLVHMCVWSSLVRHSSTARFATAESGAKNNGLFTMVRAATSQRMMTDRMDAAPRHADGLMESHDLRRERAIGAPAATARGCDITFLSLRLCVPP